MPVVDYPALVCARVFACLQAGVGAYNADVAAAVQGDPVTGYLYGLRRVSLAKGLINDATTGRLQVRLGSADAAAYPRLGASLTGGTDAVPVRPTFGFLAARPGCDAVLARTVTWSEVIEYDPAQTSDSGTTPLEAYVDHAFAMAQPRLAVASATPPLVGIDCARRGFLRTHVRRDEPRGSAGGVQTVRRTTGSVELWPHLIDMQP